MDGFRFEVLEEDGRWAPAGLVNGDFEEAEEGDVSGWATPSPGWSYGPATVEVPSGSQYLRIAQGRATISGPLFPQAPEVGEVAQKSLGRGIMARIPLALYSREGHTLGTPEAFRATALAASLREVALPSLTAEDEALRLADVIMAWNVFQHFYPYFDVVDADWDEVLTISLERALQDRTPAAYLATLRWMVSRLQDGHGFVVGPAEPTMALPIRVDWVEGEVVVVATDDPESFQPGDVIESIDGRPAGEVLDELASTFSGSDRWRRWRGLGQFDLGPEGSVAELELRRDGETVEVSRVRDAARLPSEPHPANIEELEPGIFYVNLDLVEMAEFQARVEDLAAAEGVVFDLKISTDLPPTEVDASSPIVAAVREVAPRITGRTVDLIGLGGATFCKSCLAAGVPAVGFGPGSMGAAHSAGESIEVRELVQFAAFTAALAARMLGAEP